MILAQIEPNAVQVAGWLASAFFIAAGLNQVLKLIDRAKEEPPPIETYVTKAESQQRQEESAARIQRLEEWNQELRREFRADLARVHQRLDDLAGDFNHQIQALPNQIIATLKNTGALE
jgi:hypothetical protein